MRYTSEEMISVSEAREVYEGLRTVFARKLTQHQLEEAFSPKIIENRLLHNIIELATHAKPNNDDFIGMMEDIHPNIKTLPSVRLVIGPTYSSSVMMRNAQVALRILKYSKVIPNVLNTIDMDAMDKYGEHLKLFCPTIQILTTTYFNKYKYRISITDSHHEFIHALDVDTEGAISNFYPLGYSGYTNNDDIALEAKIHGLKVHTPETDNGVIYKTHSVW